MMGQYGDLQGLINQAYADRTTEGMSMLEGQGEQAQQDIVQNYQNMQNSSLANLAMSGLGGSTVTSSVMQGISGEQADAEARLQEQLAAQMFGAYSGLTGQQLGAQQALGQGAINLGSSLGLAELSAQQQGQQYGTDMMSVLGLAGLSAQQQGQQFGSNMLSDVGQFGLSMTDAASAQNIGLQQENLNNYTQLASQAGQASLNAQANTGQWNLSNMLNAQQSLMSEQQQLNMLPIDYLNQNLQTQIGSAMGFGLPPQVMNPWQMLGQSLNNWSMAQMSQPSGESSGSSGNVGFQTPFGGFGFGF